MQDGTGERHTRDRKDDGGVAQAWLTLGRRDEARETGAGLNQEDVDETEHS